MVFTYLSQNMRDNVKLGNNWGGTKNYRYPYPPWDHSKKGRYTYYIQLRIHISNHIISYDIILRHIISYYFILHHIVSWYYIVIISVSSYIRLFDTTLVLGVIWWPQASKLITWTYLLFCCMACSITGWQTESHQATWSIHLISPSPFGVFLHVSPCRCGPCFFMEVRQPTQPLPTSWFAHGTHAVQCLVLATADCDGVHTAQRLL